MLHGTDLISRSTQNTFRTLLLFSVAAVAISEFKLAPNVLDFFETAPSLDQQELIVILVLAFSLVSHLVHWFADYVIYSSWFKRGDAPINSVDQAGAYRNREDIFSALERKLNAIKKTAEGNNIELIETNLKDIRGMLDDIGPGFKLMRWTSRLVVFGWYLAFPLAVGLYSICSATHLSP